MSILNALKPVLRGQSAVTIRLSLNSDSSYRVLVTPTLQGVDADTENVELANIQALLAAPFALTIPADADLDATVAEAVRQFHALREPKLNELDALRERMAASEADAKKRAEEAKEAAKAKAAKGKPAPAKVAAKPAKPAPPPTGDMFGTPAPPPTAGADAGEEAEGTEAPDTGSDTHPDDETDAADASEAIEEATA